MNEKKLVILCLIISISGIIIIFIANKLIEPKYLKISEVNLNYNYIKINGTVSSVFTSKTETTFIKIKDDTGIIDVVIFKDGINTTLLKPGMSIEVIGRPQKYKEKIEIIPINIKLN